MPNAFSAPVQPPQPAAGTVSRRHRARRRQRSRDEGDRRRAHDDARRGGDGKDGADPASAADAYNAAIEATQSSTGSPLARRPRTDLTPTARVDPGEAAVVAILCGAHLPPDVAVAFETSTGRVFAATLRSLRAAGRAAPSSTLLSPTDDGASDHSLPGSRLEALAVEALSHAYPPPILIVRRALQFLRKQQLAAAGTGFDNKAAPVGGFGRRRVEPEAALQFITSLPTALPGAQVGEADPIDSHSRRRRRGRVAVDVDAVADAAHTPPLALPPQLKAAAARDAVDTPSAINLVESVPFPKNANPQMAEFIFDAIGGAPVAPRLDALTAKAHAVLAVAMSRPGDAPMTHDRLQQTPLAQRHFRVEFLAATKALGFSPKAQLVLLFGSKHAGGPDPIAMPRFDLITAEGDPVFRGRVDGSGSSSGWSGTESASATPPPAAGLPPFELPAAAAATPFDAPATEAAFGGSRPGGIVSSNPAVCVFGPFLRGGVHAWTLRGGHVEALGIGVVSTALSAHHTDFSRVPGCAVLLNRGDLRQNFGPTFGPTDLVKATEHFGTRCEIVLTVHYGFRLITWAAASTGHVLALQRFDGRPLAPAMMLRHGTAVEWAYTPWMAAPLELPSAPPPADEADRPSASPNAVPPPPVFVGFDPPLPQQQQ